MRAFEFLTEYLVKGGRHKKYRDGGKPEWYEKAVQLKTDNPRMSAKEIGRQVGISKNAILYWIAGSPNSKDGIYNDKGCTKLKSTHDQVDAPTRVVESCRFR